MKRFKIGFAAPFLFLFAITWSLCPGCDCGCAPKKTSATTITTATDSTSTSDSQSGKDSTEIPAKNE